MIETVYRPDGGAFYEKNGFLLMSQEELTKTTEQLVQQQGLLGPLAADPVAARHHAGPRSRRHGASRAAMPSSRISSGR